MQIARFTSHSGACFVERHNGNWPSARDEIVGVLISFHFTLDHVDLLSLRLDLSGLVSASTVKGRLLYIRVQYFGI